jgi:hypothetical protein
MIELWPKQTSSNFDPQEHRESLQVQNLPDSFDWDQKGAPVAL